MKNLLTLILPLLFMAAAPAVAERSQTFGNLTVHYNAITTDTLTPDIARAYNITRSKYRGLLTVSVLRPNKLGVGEPVPAKISAYAANLSEQLRNIDMREIREGGAIYYLGEFSIAPRETLRFTLNISAEGRKDKLEFQQVLLPE
jgi:hypothetical protein